MANDKRYENWLRSRKVSERIIIEGTLVLETPVSLSNGDADGDTDISLLKDPYDGRALLTGTSITGALRNYLRERLLNYTQEEFLDENGKRKTKKEPNGNVKKDKEGYDVFEDLPIVTRLFGSLERDGEQSHLIVDDALQTEAKPETELRDGVKIKAETRTAEDKAKFDTELLQAGTEFPLRFELLITNYTGAPQREDLVKNLATALQGFEKGEIQLGGRKRRGYGQCRVSRWNVTRFDLTTKDGLLAWLDCRLGKAKKVRGKSRIAEALKEAYELNEEPKLEDNRSYFKLTACFALDGSMLIRSGSALEEGVQPDTVHLRSNRKQSNGQKKTVPIVSGTSLGGVLRHRAVRIAKTIAADNEKLQLNAERFVEKIFGVDMEKLKERNAENKKNNKPLEETFASRLEVSETEIDESKTNSLVHTRVKIDRFTGGAFEGALFDAAPVFAKDGGKAVELSLKLRSPKESEIGLLLLLLKDLWTSDLAIGGESSIGRGRLKGQSACLRYQSSTDNWAVCLSESVNGNSENKKIEITGDKDHAFFNSLVEKLNEQLK